MSKSYTVETRWSESSRSRARASSAAWEPPGTFSSTWVKTTPVVSHENGLSGSSSAAVPTSGMSSGSSDSATRYTLFGTSSVRRRVNSGSTTSASPCRSSSNVYRSPRTVGGRRASDRITPNGSAQTA